MKEHTQRVLAAISAIILVAMIGFVWRAWYVEYHGFLDEVGTCKDSYYEEYRKAGLELDMTDKEVWDLCVTLVQGSDKG